MLSLVFCHSFQSRAAARKRLRLAGRSVGRTLLGLALFLSVFAHANAASEIKTVDVPGASQGAKQGTAVLTIGQSGDVAGVFTDSSNVLHVFVQSSDGNLASVEPPTTGGKPNLGAAPIAFDTAGDLLGIYVDSNQTGHGFVYSRAGQTSVIDAPGAGTGAGRGTFPMAIDAAGNVAGIYRDSDGNRRGFFYPAGGPATVFDTVLPNGDERQGTYFVTINGLGNIAGTFETSDGIVHGFIRSPSGIMIVDVAGAGTTHGYGTAISAIDASGKAAGVYYDANNILHGFVRTPDGTITKFDAPVNPVTGIAQSIYPLTDPLQFDSAGDLAGFYMDSSQIVHGFVRSASGTVTSFDAPDAAPLSAGMKRFLSQVLRHNQSAIGPRGFAARSRNLVSGIAGVLSSRTAPERGMSLIGESYLGDAASGTVPGGMDLAGDLTGMYFDSDAVGHPFVRTAAGVLTEFNVPGAGTGAYQGAAALAILNANTVAGAYLDGNSVFHGFVATLSQTATTTTLNTPNPSSVVYGQPVTLTATVSAGSSPVQDGETVQFASNTASLGTATTTGGEAVLTTTAIPTNATSISAVFAGDANYAGSTSSPVSITVAKANSTTTLTSSQNPSTAGQSVQFTASVSGQYGGTLTGSVSFYSGGSSLLGTGTVNGGKASFSTSALAAGSYSVTAVYQGDNNFTTSTSVPVAQVVNPVAVSASTLSSMTPAIASAGGAAFTLTVNGSGFISGSKVYWGSNALTTTFVSASQLTAQVPASDIATAGQFAITVQTPGATASSNSIQFEVDPASSGSTAPTITTPTATVTAGATATYPVTMPSTVTSVTVNCLNLPAGATCSYSTTGAVTIATASTTPKGSYQITVVFTQTVSGAAAAGIVLPFLLLPLAFARSGRSSVRKWLLTCGALVLMAGSIFAIGCGGSSSTSTSPATHQQTNSGTVTLTVQ